MDKKHGSADGEEPGSGRQDAQADKHSKSHKKHKDKDKKQHSKQDKNKKAKKANKGRHSLNDSSSSDDAPEALNPRQQLQRERAAVTCLRDLLWLHQSMRKELRELLWTVDQGKAANLAGVADADLKLRLKQLLKLLGLRSTGSKGSYALPKDGSPTLGVLGFVFEEQPRPPPTPKPAPVKPAPQTAPEQAPPVRAHTAAKDPKGGGGSIAQAAGGVEQAGLDMHDRRHSQQQEEEPGGPAPLLRRMGPAMPDPEMLAAAARMAETMSYEEPDAGARGGVDEDLVGPAPPELIEEMDAVPEDAREAEVVRIMRLLKVASLAQPQHSLLAAAVKQEGELAGLPPNLDIYELLGLAADVVTTDIKKRFMRLSLLIHPDKCHHKDAHTAFQAVVTASKTLQDAIARAAVDEARADKALRARAIEAATAQERARQWRVARGEEAPGPAITADNPKAPVRDTWMTDIPEERVATAGPMSQVSVRAFSSSRIQPRGDTSDWTSTPLSLAAEAAGGGPQHLHGASTLLLTSGGMAGRASGTGRPSAADARTLDAFNLQARKKTLLEQHLESGQHGISKKQKVEETSVANPAGHPWRPFDRDKDLQLKPKSVDPASLLASQGALAGKFSSSQGGTRHFL